MLVNVDSLPSTSSQAIEHYLVLIVLYMCVDYVFYSNVNYAFSSFFFAAGKYLFGQGMHPPKTSKWTAKESDHCPLHSTQGSAGWEVYGSHPSRCGYHVLQRCATTSTITICISWGVVVLRSLGLQDLLVHALLLCMCTQTGRSRFWVSSKRLCAISPRWS